MAKLKLKTHSRKDKILYYTSILFPYGCNWDKVLKDLSKYSVHSTPIIGDNKLVYTFSYDFRILSYDHKGAFYKELPTSSLSFSRKPSF